MSDKKAPNGIQFPVDAKGKRSTTGVAKRIWTTAMGDDAAYKQAVMGEKDWRHKYGPYVVRLAEAMMKSKETCIAIAERGIKAALGEFEFVRDGNTQPFAQAMANITDTFETAVFEGKHDKPAPFSVPYEGKSLSGEDLIKKVEEWCTYGTGEASVAESVKTVVGEAKEVEEAIKDKVFVVIGATSAMGPLKTLLSLGATVVGISRPSRKWADLIAFARDSPGTLLAPAPLGTDLSKSDEELAKVVGADLLTQAPELRTWLCDLEPSKRLVLGCYVYLDGGAHVRATVAMDAIAAEILAKRPSTVLAYLASMGTAHPIPQAAYEDSIKNYDSTPWWTGPVGFLTGSFTGFPKNARTPVTSEDEKETYYVHDGCSVVQGPNYQLAKTLQNWRAALAWSQGHVVSANMAPPARTESMLHNKQVATALRGMPHYKPLMVFDYETVSPIMTLLLFADINDDRSGTDSVNPMEVFFHNSWHGGLWRVAYKPDSIGTSTYLLGLVS